MSTSLYRIDELDVQECTGLTEGDPTQAIRIADSIVTHRIVVTTIGAKLDNETLFAIETYLASHFYYLGVREGPLAAEIIGDATERYHQIYSKGLDATRFGQQAVMLDPTGVLAAMADLANNPQRKKAQFQVISPEELGPANIWWPWWSR